MIIREVTVLDAERIAEIYNYYIASTTISFEEAPISAQDMMQRIETITASGFPWIVALVDNEIVGYAYANHWKMRSAYRYSVESSVYLVHDSTGSGVGRALYGELLTQLRTRGFSTAIGGIALPNPASIGLHESLGFKKVGEFSNVGVKFGEKKSVGYWQLEL
ncbi:arsinothricin resistance N-acetyltransferase ArsN1 family B [Vibrio sp. WJH972]